MTGSAIRPSRQAAVLDAPPSIAGTSLGWLLLRTAPFWLLLFYGSFIPATRNQWLRILDVPVDSFDVLMAAMAGLYLLIFLNTPRRTASAAWDGRLPLATAGILIFAAVSFLWNGLDQPARTAMAVNLAISAVTVALSYFLVATLPSEDLDGFLFLLSGVIAITGLAYSAESFLGLNLRSELGRSYSVGFGIERVHGPLFAASRGHIILLPAIGYIVQKILLERSRRLLNGLMLLSLVLTSIGLGSRAAIVLLFLFMVVVCWVARRRLPAILIFLAIVAISAGVVFSIASAQRLDSMMDSGRLTTHVTAWETFRGRDFARNVIGPGYGSVWHWYLEDVTLGEKIAHGWLMRWTDYGMTLYNSHSLPLLLIIELGCIGLLYLLKLWWELARLFAAGFERGPGGIFACGVAISSLAMFAEILIFKDPKTSAIWLIFLLAALRSSAIASKVSRR